MQLGLRLLNVQCDHHPAVRWQLLYAFLFFPACTAQTKRYWILYAWKKSLKIYGSTTRKRALGNNKRVRSCLRWGICFILSSFSSFPSFSLPWIPPRRFLICFLSLSHWPRLTSTHWTRLRPSSRPLPSSCFLWQELGLTRYPSFPCAVYFLPFPHWVSNFHQSSLSSALLKHPTRLQASETSYSITE